MFIVRSACDKSTFRLCPHGKLQNTKELTSRWDFKGESKSPLSAFSTCKVIYLVMESSHLRPKGNRFLTPLFHTPLSFYMRSDTAKFS